MRSILLLLFYLALTGPSVAQDTVDHFKEWLSSGSQGMKFLPPPIPTEKTFFFQGDSIVVYRTFKEYCPSGAPFCEHGHMPARELTYYTNDGVLCRWQRYSWNEPLLVEEKWLPLVEMLRKDEEFGPASFGL